MLRRSAVLLCAGFAACRIDVSDPLSARPAILTISITLVDSADVARVDLNAAFNSGFDDAGEPRRILADTFGVFGYSLVPTRVQRDGTRVFTRSWPLGEAVPGMDEPLRLPATAALAPPPIASGIRLAPAMLPDTLVVGDELVIPLRPDAVEASDTLAQVQLLIMHPGGWGVTSLTLNVVPDTIALPRSVLPDLESALLRISGVKFSNRELLGGDYHVRIAERFRILRALRFTDGTS